MAVLLLLVVFLASAMRRAQVKSRQMGCFSRLRSIGVAFKMFAGENGGLYPFAATNSLAYQDTTNAWKHFQSLSNDIGSGKILQCPADIRRPACYSFDNGPDGLVTLKNQAITYFINVDAHETNSGMILIGDRNIIIGGQSPTNTGLTLPATTQLQWTADLHHGRGNVALTDGSVQSQVRSISAWTNHTNPVRLAIP